jgi:hypothetical protein
MANNLTRFDPFSELTRFEPFNGLDEWFRDFHLRPALRDWKWSRASRSMSRKMTSPTPSLPTCRA